MFWAEIRKIMHTPVNPNHCWWLCFMLHSLIARRRFGPQTQWRPLRKTLTSVLGRDDMSLAWPAVVQLCHLVLCFSVLLVLRLPRLGNGEEANLSAFRTFVRFLLVWICRFPLPLGVWEGLRFGLWLWHSLDFSLTFIYYIKVGFKGVKVL